MSTVTPRAPLLEAALYDRESLPRQAWKELRSAIRYRGLIRHLVRSSLATESTGTVFGSVWWLLDPLILMGVYVIFVDVIMGGGGENFVLFIFISVTAWKHFSSGINGAIILTLTREQLMRQIAFPKSVLPIAAAIAETIHFLIALAIFVPLALFFGVYPDPTLPLVLVPLAIQTMLLLGLGFLLASLNIFFRDIQNISGYALRLLFLLSPALYPVDRIPDSLKPFYALNPFSYILPAFHSILLDHEVPPMGPLAVVGVVSLATLVVGFLTFVRLEQSFIKVI